MPRDVTFIPNLVVTIEQKAMSTYTYRIEAESPIPCTCGNHLVMEEGSNCDICMGQVFVEESAPLYSSSFDEAYFEELEALEEWTPCSAA